MWYYVVLNNMCIGICNSIEDVNCLLARNKLTVIKLEQKREFETIVEVAHF